ncbi:MAG: paraquat-inducible protein [Desulfovibrionales bacterium]|jgi:paraquat-inducible protein A|nr:paraquat-inducible protein [Desulfovibrionales bacterium]
MAQTTILCRECDLTLAYRPLARGEAAKCPRCGAVVYRGQDTHFSRILALSFTGLFFFLLCSFNPIITMRAAGETSSNTLFSGIPALYAEGFPFLALLVFLTSFLLPAFKFSALILVFGPLALGRKPAWSRPMLRMFWRFNIWGMVDVYMLGVLVALTKLKDLAMLSLGVGFYSFIGLFIVSLWLAASLDPVHLWTMAEGHPEGAK